MKIIHIIIAAITIGIIISSCVYFNHFCPCPNELREIEEKPYVDDKYTCLHKSRDYYHALKKAGYDAYMVIGTVNFDDRNHAWVEIRHEGKIYWVDPTTKSGCWESYKFLDREIIKSPYASPDYKYRKE